MGLVTFQRYYNNHLSQSETKIKMIDLHSWPYCNLTVNGTLTLLYQTLYMEWRRVVVVISEWDLGIFSQP